VPNKVVQNYFALLPTSIVQNFTNFKNCIANLRNGKNKNKNHQEDATMVKVLS
jgi:hypothetical protein